MFAPTSALTSMLPTRHGDHPGGAAIRVEHHEGATNGVGHRTRDRDRIPVGDDVEVGDRLGAEEEVSDRATHEPGLSAAHGGLGDERIEGASEVVTPQSPSQRRGEVRVRVGSGSHPRTYTTACGFADSGDGGGRMAVRIWQCGRFTLSLDRPLVMGVLNVTPDSFSDGGTHATTEAAISWGEHLVAEGAAIVDVGGESTRPAPQPSALPRRPRASSRCFADSRQLPFRCPSTLGTWKSLGRRCPRAQASSTTCRAFATRRWYRCSPAPTPGP